MGKLLILGAVVLISFLLFSSLFLSSDTTATSEPSGTETTETIQNITADMRNRFDSFQSGTDTSEDSVQSTEYNKKSAINEGTQLRISRYYTFSAGADKQYSITLIPETVPCTLHITYYPSQETYEKGYTDSFTKKWTEITRTIYSPDSCAEITIFDQSGRVVSTLGFGGTYSTELTSKTTLRSQEQHTITITGNHISLDYSCSYP